MKLKFLIKLGISLLMIALVLTFVDITSLRETLFSIPLKTAVIVVVGYLLGQILSAYKWLIIARSGGIKTSYPAALKAYFIGMFVNCFGLGVVGGDVTRGILISGGKGKKTVGVASVIADRAQGLGVLALMGLLGVAFYTTTSVNSSLTILVLLLAGAIVVGWIIGPSLLLKFFPKDSKLRPKVEQVAAAFPKKLSTLIIITVLSVAFHLLQIWLHQVMGDGLGVHLSWPLLLATIPFVNILSSLPISWNGLGVRETSYIFFLSTYITDEQAVSMGAIWLLAVTVTSGIGGITSVLTKDFSVYRKSATDDAAVA